MVFFFKEMGSKRIVLQTHAHSSVTFAWNKVKTRTVTGAGTKNTLELNDQMSM
jgi:hypothetical protein